MAEHIELTETQSQFVVTHFTEGERLLEHVVEFKESEDMVQVGIVPGLDYGITLSIRYQKDCIWLIAFSSKVIATFERVSEFIRR